MKVTVIGAGSWGTALAIVLARAEHDVLIWAREQEISFGINNFHENKTYLPGVTLPDSIVSHTDLSECLQERDLIVFATPSHTTREVASKVKPMLSGNEICITVSKGIENGTFMTMSQVLTEVLNGKIIEDHIGVLYGPSHAEEVSRNKPTLVVASANSKSTARIIQEAFMTPMFRVYVNQDVMGVEIAGSVKNVIAIAAGVIDGANLGDNAKAALLTRGLAEMRRLGMHLGASQDTFSGLAGMGDLIATCTSQHSRNRYVGYHVGKGEKVDAIIARMNMVAEGVKTTKSVHGWATKLGITMPITEAVYKVLFEDFDPRDAVFQLMTRDPKEEHRN
ncbi:NAD(P)H-dependent glycerol-3-phosphate dehydrogenase [bacterium]|nr:MAG: NAD(P)H-dependent glycerol-3-phosphate dehydrogenase [bacterium]